MDDEFILELGLSTPTTLVVHNRADDADNMDCLLDIEIDPGKAGAIYDAESVWGDGADKPDGPPSAGGQHDPDQDKAKISDDGHHITPGQVIRLRSEALESMPRDDRTSDLMQEWLQTDDDLVQS